MNDIQIQNILAEGFELEDLYKTYNIVPGSELDTLIQLAKSLESVLVKVEPSAKFVRQLRQELTGEKRLRYLSTRQMIATVAGVGSITVIAGVVWWFTRGSEKAPALAS